MKSKQRQTIKNTQKQTISANKYFQPAAMVNAAWVAEVYQNGWGVRKDYGKAHTWFQKAAGDGNTDAMISLGRLYEQGLGVARDYGKALEWFQKAVGAGNRDATVNLSRLHEHGLVSNMI
jgi:TPR repeat protein